MNKLILFVGIFFFLGVSSTNAAPMEDQCKVQLRYLIADNYYLMTLYRLRM